MNKFDELRKNININCLPAEKQNVSEMLEELYNVARDFSQIIKIDKKDGVFGVTHNPNNGTAEYAMSCKKRMQDWVGGR